ncbi:MAG: SDR family NAD(P)-dependent oxidoreductase [Deltaproteobacteria bacterium]|nr:SDR family NAD(P)-dependent oxidoreductase [Deltaproteobacteria bacterium]MDQ3295973.1 SDR family NAD(P)-dependent oxidoreductase [Myxococcota bacterium]
MIPREARVVVTGAGSGLGAALCDVLAARGARIVAADLDLAAAAATAGRCGSQVHPVQCDVADLGAVERLAEEADRLIGGVDLLVNNAGVAVVGQMGVVPIEDWRWVIDVNLWGVIHGCHVFVPRLRAQGHGHVLNVASAAGLIAMPSMAPYNVTKAAVVALSETLYADLAGDGVGVSVLCPSFFPTNLTRSPRTSVDAKLHGAAMRLVAKGGWTAEQVAKAALAGVDAGTLHVTPQLDLRWAWRFKRLAPTTFQRLSRRMAAIMIGK